MSSNAWLTVVMPSSSSSSTVTSNSSSRSITIWTRSRLSASRSSAKFDSTLISSTGFLRLSAAVLRKRSNSSSLIGAPCAEGGGGSVAHRQTTVHRDDGTGDEGRLVGGEKAYGGRHLFGSAEPSEGYLRPAALAPLVGHRVGHVGVDRARRDDVRGDAAGSVLPGDR